MSGIAHAQTPPSGRFIGSIFGDAFYKQSGHDRGWGSTQYADVSWRSFAIELRRVQLGYEYTYDDRFTGTVLFEANDSQGFQDTSNGVFVKEAHLTWRNPLGDLQMGLVTTPMFAYVENAWGFRSIEKDVLQMRTSEPSTAFGLSLQGDIGSRAGYHVMVGSNDWTSGTAAYGSVRTQLGGGFHTEVMLARVPRGFYMPLKVGRLFLGLDNDRGSFGISATAAYEEEGYQYATRFMMSAFAVVPAPSSSSRVNLFARYDFYDPDLDFLDLPIFDVYDGPEVFYRQNLAILGINVQAHPQIHFVPNVWINAYSRRNEGHDQRKERADVVLRMTIHVKLQP